MKVELTKYQCISLADFISLNLLEVIRNDTDIDNLDFVHNLLNALDTFKEAITHENT